MAPYQSRPAGLLRAFKFPLKIQTGALSPPGWPPASADFLRRMACYTSPFPPMLKTTIKPGICMSLLLLFLAGTRAQQPTPSLGESASEFAQDILSRGLPNAVSVTFENLVNFPADDLRNMKDAILGRFRGASVRITKAESAAAEVQITFSENLQELVWVANVKQNGSSHVVIKNVARPQRTSASRTPLVTLQRNVLMMQATPILDFLHDDKTLLILEPDEVSVYTSDSGRWKPTAVLGIAHNSAWPRDLRGRITGNAKQITVFLPGTICTGAASPPQLQCRASEDPWPLDSGQFSAFFATSRNFFTGVLAGQNAGTSVPAFFSAATWRSNDTQRTLFTGNDGRARLYLNNLSSPAATFNDWGSEAAAIHTNCGSGWQLLISSASNSTRPDNIQAMDFVNRDAVAASSPVEISGPVRALWPSSNGQTVNGVAQSATTGKYEAFTLTASCNQ